MSEKQPSRLSRDQIFALKFAAHRQLARWSRKSGLSSRQPAQRIALRRAVRVLQDQAFAHGCEVRVPGGDADA